MAAVTVKGADSVIKSLRKFGADVEEQVKGIIEDTATNIEIKAIRNKGAKLSFIRIDKLILDEGWRAVIGPQGDNLLAVYFEFGTGLSAKQILSPYPESVKKLARQYFITGRGTLRGRPYLFPAYFEESRKFVRELQKMLDKESNKFNKQ